PHPLRDQRLADGVVDLVRAGVVEVLALQEQPEVAAAQARELRRLGDRRRAPDEFLEDAVELRAKRAVALQLPVRRLEFIERRHQRFGNEFPAELTEEAAPVRNVHPRTRAISARTFS